MGNTLAPQRPRGGSSSDVGACSDEPAAAAGGSSLPGSQTRGTQRRPQKEERRRQHQQQLVPAELVKFLQTAPGAAWLADVLLEWPGRMAKLRTASLADVNAFVISKYGEFKSSDMGQRMLTTPGDRRAATASSADLSLLPIYIVEDVIRQRLRAQITHNWQSIGLFLATRTPLMCAAVHLAKLAVKRHVLRTRERRGRWRRLARAVAFVLDELVPTGFYGMLLTYGLLARRMVRELEDN